MPPTLVASGGPSKNDSCCCCCSSLLERSQSPSGLQEATNFCACHPTSGAAMEVPQGLQVVPGQPGSPHYAAAGQDPSGSWACPVLPRLLRSICRHKGCIPAILMREDYNALASQQVRTAYGALLHQRHNFIGITSSANSTNCCQRKHQCIRCSSPLRGVLGAVSLSFPAHDFFT